MNRRPLYVLLIAFAATALVAGVSGWWDWAMYSTPYRYRLTVTVEIDGQMRTGSTVVEVRSVKNWTAIANLDAPTPSAWVTRARCEALYLRFGDGPGDNLFVLVPRVATWLAGNAIKGIGPERGVAFEFPGDEPEVEAARGKVFEISAQELPPIVRFRDLSDPMTLESVAPDALDRTYGRSAKFVEAHLQVTDDPVVHAMDYTLPWLRQYEGKNIGGKWLETRIFGKNVIINVADYYNFSRY